MSKTNAYWLGDIFQTDSAAGDGGTVSFLTTQDMHSINSLSVYKNGLHQELSVDYAVTLPRTILFATAPLTGESLIFKYVKKV